MVVDEYVFEQQDGKVVYKKLEAVAPAVVCVVRTTHDRRNKLTNK